MKKILQKYPFSFMQSMCLLGTCFSGLLVALTLHNGNSEAATAWANSALWSFTAFISTK